MGKGTGEVINPKAGDELGEHHLGTGAGASGGAVAGAALGAVGGPIGMAAGAAIGAVAGGVAGKGAAGVVNPQAGDTYWESAYKDRPYFSANLGYEDYKPAYQLGYNRAHGHGGSFDQAEPELRNDWEAAKGGSKLTWDEARHPVRDAWERISR